MSLLLILLCNITTIETIKMQIVGNILFCELQIQMSKQISLIQSLMLSIDKLVEFFSCMGLEVLG